MFFFFKQKTAYEVRISDWSSDVCSSDLIWIAAPNDRRRSFDFVLRIPFVRAAGYYDQGPTGLHGKWARDQGYRRKGGSVFARVDGHDFFISVNGRLDKGESLDAILPEYRADWDLPFFVPKAEEPYGRSEESAFGPYVVAAFFSSGFYRAWNDE